MPVKHDAFYGPDPAAVFDYDSLDEACKLWVECYVRLRRVHASRPSGPREAHRWLRKLAYRIIRLSLEEADGYADLADRIDSYGRRAGHTPGAAGPFQTGLLALFAHAPDALTADQRYQMGRQLEYAHYHLVPQDFLEAFLRDVGARKAIDDAGKGWIHPDYTAWVVNSLHKGKADRFVLKSYPAPIREAVTALNRPKPKPGPDDDDWVDG